MVVNHDISDDNCWLEGGVGEGRGESSWAFDRVGDGRFMGMGWGEAYPSSS